MTHILRVLGTLALLGMLAASLGPAHAMQLQVSSGAPYLCAVVQGGNTASGTPVIAYSCSGGPEDQWQFVNGQLQGIGTANGKSMCLDVKGAGTAAGTLVDLWPCNGQQNQQWDVTSFAGPGSFICSVPTGMCLDSSSGPSVGGGTQLVINYCCSAASQNWTLRGMQLELHAAAPYVCANVEASKTADGTPVLKYSCDDAPNELWEYVNGNIQGIGTENGKSMCLYPPQVGVGPVTLSACTNLSRVWKIEPGGSGIVPGSGTALVIDAGCLDSSGGPTVGGGTQLMLNPCSGAASQNWILR